MPLLSDLSRTRPSKPTLAAAAVALAVVLRYLYAKRGAPNPFGDPARAARRIGGRDDEYDFDEYDVVIVGGGTS